MLRRIIAAAPPVRMRNGRAAALARHWCMRLALLARCAQTQCEIECDPAGPLANAKMVHFVCVSWPVYGGGPLLLNTVCICHLFSSLGYFRQPERHEAERIGVQNCAPL